VPLCSPQIPHLTWARTRAAAVGSRRLTAWAMARPVPFLTGPRVPSLPLRLSYESTPTNWSVLACPGRTEYRSRFPTLHVIACLSVAAGTVCSVTTLWFLQAYPLPRVSALASRCLATDVYAVLLWLHTSGVHASCYVTRYYIPVRAAGFRTLFVQSIA
jgi:hypothetical protein